MRHWISLPLAALLGCAGTEAVAPDAEPPRAAPSTTPGPGGIDAAVQPLDRGVTVNPRPDAAPADAAPAVDASWSVDAGSGDAAPAGDAAEPDWDAAPPDAGPGPCGPEICDGLDDDCDGEVDEGAVCGPWAQAHCQVWLGWADERRGPRGASPSWGACPGQLVDRGEDVRCGGTRGDGAFVTVDLNGDVNDDDQLGVALRCEDAAEPALAAWAQRHCALYLGWADNNRGSGGRASWGRCPQLVEHADGDVRCTSTGFDGWFRPMNLDGDVDGNDDLAVAWVCGDPDDPARAEAMSQAVEVILGWADRDRGPATGSLTWGGCPQAPEYNEGDVRCASTQGDQRFHTVHLSGDVNRDDQLGLALRARP